MEVLQKIKNIFSSEIPRILLIEDTVSMVDRISSILLDISPVAVLHAPKSYTEAKQYLKEGGYDLILLDNSLTGWSDAAGVSGVRIIPLIKDTNPKAFILFISNEEGVGKILVQEGMVDHYVYKKDFDDLVEELKNLSY